MPEEKKTKDGNRQESTLRLAVLDELKEGLNATTVEGVDLVIVKQGKSVSVFSGVCLHDEALLANGYLEGNHLVCGSHLWRYHIHTGQLVGEPGVYLKKLQIQLEEGNLLINPNDLNEFKELEED